VKDTLIRLKDAVQNEGFSTLEFRDEFTLTIPVPQLLPVLTYLKEKEGFRSLVDISSTHWENRGEIHVVWQVRCLSDARQVRVKVIVGDDETNVPSVTGLWGSANWQEREVYDLMGIQFEGHPDLRRILLPEEFSGFPLRREFPMEGDDEWRNYLAPGEG